jgi:hypothetical protein
MLGRPGLGGQWIRPRGRSIWPRLSILQPAMNPCFNFSLRPRRIVGKPPVISDQHRQVKRYRCRRKAIHSAAPPRLIGPADA